MISSIYDVLKWYKLNVNDTFKLGLNKSTRKNKPTTYFVVFYWLSCCPKKKKNNIEISKNQNVTVHFKKNTVCQWQTMFWGADQFRFFFLF